MATVEMPWTRVRGLDPRAVDVTVALILGVIVVVQEASTAHPGVIALLAGAASAATVAWRRRIPALTTFAAAVCIGLLARSGGAPDLELVVIVLNYYMLGRCSAERGWGPLEVLLVVLALPTIAVVPGSSGAVDVASTWAVFIAVPLVGGWVIGSRTAVTQELRADARRLESEQRERARRAISDERVRIARELHDVVAHSVSVMVIQTAAARRLAGQDREAAREALGSVAGCGREALGEMRRMVGVLRRGDLDLAGAPGLSQLQLLAERARASGLPVELRIEGESRPLSGTLDLVAFRLVQEALTNVIKHAGPARARVRVAYTARALEIEVVDTGRGPGTLDPGSEVTGHGLIGMQERLAQYGGELRTGRGRGGGFHVRARIPLTEAVAA